MGKVHESVTFNVHDVRPVRLRKGRWEQEVVVSVDEIPDEEFRLRPGDSLTVRGRPSWLQRVVERARNFMHKEEDT